MKSSHLPLFGSAGESLEFVGQRDGDELVEGKVVAFGGREVCRVSDTIAIFPSAVERPFDWSGYLPGGMGPHEWLAQHWPAQQDYSQWPLPARLHDALAEVDGPILEIAAGPDGGHMPGVLLRNPNAEILVNDIDYGLDWCLWMWRKFFAEHDEGKRVSLVAFDSSRMPFRDASLVAVSSCCGFLEISGCGLSEIPDSAAAAAREAARVLAPGGLIFADESVLDPDDFARLPTEILKGREQVFERWARSLTGMIEEAGFRIEWYECAPNREALRPERGTLPGEAAGHGLTLHIRREYLIAVKP